MTTMQAWSIVNNIISNEKIKLFNFSNNINNFNNVTDVDSQISIAKIRVFWIWYSIATTTALLTLVEIFYAKTLFFSHYIVSYTFSSFARPNCITTWMGKTGKNTINNWYSPRGVVLNCLFLGFKNYFTFADWDLEGNPSWEFHFSKESKGARFLQWFFLLFSVAVVAFLFASTIIITIFCEFAINDAKTIWGINNISI